MKQLLEAVSLESAYQYFRIEAVFLAQKDPFVRSRLGPLLAMGRSEWVRLIKERMAYGGDMKPARDPAWEKHLPGVTYEGYSLYRLPGDKYPNGGHIAEMTLYSTFRNPWRHGRALFRIGSQFVPRCLYKTEEAAVKALADEVRQLRDALNVALGEGQS